MFSKHINIKKHLNKIKKVSYFALMGVGFIIGLAAMYFYLQPKLTYQEKIVSENKALAIKSQKEASVSALLLASASAEIKALHDAPPKIEYRTVTQTQYVPQYVQSPNNDEGLQTQIRQQQEKIDSLVNYQQHPDSTHCIMSGGVPQSDGSCMNFSK